MRMLLNIAGMLGGFCLVVRGGLGYEYGEVEELYRSRDLVLGSGMSFRNGSFEAASGRRRENEGWLS